MVGQSEELPRTYDLDKLPNCEYQEKVIGS